MTLRAIVLFAHGSRDPLWSRPVEAVAARILALDPSVLVACAYLEMMEPDLPTVTRRLVQAGANRISIVPMFLGVGRHAREDLPKLIEALVREHHHIGFDLRQAIGEEQRVVDLMAEIALSS